MTARQRWTLVATIIGSGIVFLDGTIVNVALPRIGQDLPATIIGVLEGQTYVVSGYLAVLAALLILAGALSDFYGRRRIFMIGAAVFGVASLLCGAAPGKPPAWTIPALHHGLSLEISAAVAGSFRRSRSSATTT